METTKKTTARILSEALAIQDQEGLSPLKVLEQRNILLAFIEKILNTSEDFGREGCTYGDTEYDSLSVVFGFNTCLQEIKAKANIIKKSLTPPSTKG